MIVAPVVTIGGMRGESTVLARAGKSLSQETLMRDTFAAQDCGV